MASLRATLCHAPKPDRLPPVSFFCPPEVLIASSRHQGTISMAAALETINSQDDPRLMAWARNKGITIRDTDQASTLQTVWQELIKASLLQGHWWTPSLDAWLFYHPSLLPLAIEHAKKYAKNCQAWLPLSDLKSIAWIMAEVAPLEIFNDATVRWLTSQPKALKKFLARPAPSLLPLAPRLWFLWLELFRHRTDQEVSLPERLLFNWLVEHTEVSVSLLASIDSSRHYFRELHPTKATMAALLRTAPTAPATAAQLIQELSVTDDWRVVVNCFDHPNSTEALGPVFQEIYDKGQLANHVLRTPVRAMARSRLGPHVFEAITLVFGSYDKTAQTLLWSRMPADMVIAMSQGILESTDGDGLPVDLVSILPTLNRPELGQALIASGYLKKWLVHPNRSVRLAAAALSGQAREKP